MTTRRLLVLASILACSGVARAEPPAEPLLAGPSANETTIPGEVRTFTGAARGRYAEQAIPHRVFLRAVGSLRAETAAEEVRLSAEQAEKIRAVEEEYRASMQAFLETNRDEIRAIRARLGLRPELGRGEDAIRRGFEEMRRVAAQPRAQRPAGEMMDDDGMAIDAVRESMRVLAEKAPRQQDAHAKVWALLTEPQRAAATRELERARAEQRESEMGGMMGRPIDVLNDPRVPEEMKQRISSMSPEDRERALARLRERLGASEPPRRAADPGKPPPTVDSVDVPKPGDRPRR